MFRDTKPSLIFFKKAFVQRYWIPNIIVYLHEFISQIFVWKPLLNHEYKNNQIKNQYDSNWIVTSRIVKSQSVLKDKSFHLNDF